MVGTFPLNVQAGSLQYTLASDITPTSSTTTITITIINTGQVTPVSNAYYTIQNEDGSKWCTFYVESWTRVGGWIPADAPITFTGSCTYSSSNTADVFPEGSICWCIWCKEYYDSLVSKIGGGNTVKVSQLEWDSNLTIPRGYSIESASGEVQTKGYLWVGRSLAVEETIECTELITSPQGTFTRLTVDGYTPTVLTSSNASISIGGGLNLIPITSQNVSISGTINGRYQGTGAVSIIAYADFYSLTRISTVTLGQTTASSGSSSGLFDISVSTTVPPKTYAIRIRLNRGDAYFQSVSINSASYTSKALI